MKKTTAIEKLTISISFLTIFLFYNELLIAQSNDTAGYLPQITVNPDPGFGPYIAGTHQSFSVMLTDLPQHTSKVVYRFIDVDSVQIGDPEIKTGTDISISVWEIWLDDFDLPLSPQVHINITYQNDSIANYFFPFVVYPDTVGISAASGWGPFITNNYTRVEGWNPVPNQINSFSLTNLPPRTQEVDFKIVNTDSSTIKSFTATAPQGQYLQNAAWNNVLMTDLPVNTMEFRAIVKCNGGPDQGLLFNKPLSIVIQNPLLTSKSGGVTLTDSIASFVHKPAGGQALHVDSAKYAVITNGPGVKNTQAPYYYVGPLSMNIIMSNPCTFEGWILIDGVKLAEHQDHSMSFMRVDSLWDISIFNEGGISVALRLSSLVGGNPLEIAYIEVGDQIFNQIGWHHFAIVIGDPLQYYLIYFDGQLLGAYSNGPNINHILNTYNINNNLRTKPLVVGGCNGQSKAKAPDFTFITAMDEIRIWNTWRSGSQIIQNMNRSILQDPNLVGYWDFDDLRNRLDFVSDESFNNNSGILHNGAIFMPENPDLFTSLDTLILKSSNTSTDSTGLYLYDEDNLLITGLKQKVQNHQVSWVCDFTSLPFNVKHLVSTEHFPGCPTGSQQTVFNVNNFAPAPVATPMLNWGTYYQSDSHLGNLTNSILVNGLPENTSKVELGLKSGNTTYNADVFTMNSVPYLYSLSLNGTDNYIKTANHLAAPSTWQISLWFKTTTNAGGMLIGFCDSPDGVPVSAMDRKLVMRKDGSLYFCFNYDGVHTDSLFAANKYNDGFWHCATAGVSSGGGCYLYVDGCQVDNNSLSGSLSYFGYWVIGRHHQTTVPAEYAEYFRGSLAYISIYTANNEPEYDIPLDRALLNGAYRGNTLFRLDEGGGTMVHDSQGSNTGTLMGTAPNWSKSAKITDVVWQHNMIDKPVGHYTFYAKVYYPGGGESGVYYPLGIYNLAEPLPNHNFSYYLLSGVGYFNEGVIQYNWFDFNTDYTGQGNPGWTANVLHYNFISPDHRIISQGEITWTNISNDLRISIDMGEAPPGSWLDIQIGYKTNSQTIIVNSFPIPILIRPMVAPTVNGDFGPFTQAVAPGTMAHSNTFTVITGEYNDISKITASFYDPKGTLINTVNGTKINNNTWTLTQDMSKLAPPLTTMKISYYLGANQFLALQAGPYKIPINKTRPDWFNFLPDSAFSSIHEYADSVTFQVTTPFENNNMINNSADFEVPGVVPLIGGSSASMETQSARAYLKFLKGSSTLALDGPPDFFQKYVNLGAGNGETLTVGFNFGQNNSYELDRYENLIASQNFTMGGSLSSGFSKFEGIITKIKALIKFISDADPESVIVKPSFSLGYTGSFRYSSRLRLITDTTTGQWGSAGNLNIDADPDHGEAYQNSASYHFYAGALGIEFSVGMEVFEGLASGNFGIDGQINMGFGHSYVTIPSFSKKPLKALNFETYCRFYIDALWGWYELTVWGPKMIYTHNFWNDNMDKCFPGSEKSLLPLEVPTGFAATPNLAEGFRTVSCYSAMPLPRPQSTVISANNSLIFNWLERGDSFGQRKLHCRFLDLSAQKFSDSRPVTTNFNAPNHPVSDKNENNVSIIVWGQSRHDLETFAASGNENQVDEFYRSQDIYFAVYDSSQDSIIQSEILEDDLLTYTSGRTEGNPRVVMLEGNHALVVWQVVYPDVPEGEIWYALLDQAGTQWEQAVAGKAFSGEGIESSLELEATDDGRAVLVWKNTNRDSLEYSTVMTSVFDGTQWSQPLKISADNDVRCNYLDLEITMNTGALVYTVFVEDPFNGHHEKVKLIPWTEGHFNTGEIATIYTDPANHLQLPSLAVRPGGKAALAIKVERLAKKEANEKISQVDVFQGDLNALSEDWLHVSANPYICDTNRQVSELNLAFISDDKYILLSQEYPAVGVNTPHIVNHGIVFGDPYMNMVLRSFQVNENDQVVDVEEDQYFINVPEQPFLPGSINDIRCYPNPCTDHTTLVFNLFESSVVKADLCDANGSIVCQLIDTRLPSGIYELSLNTKELNPGIYLIRLASDRSVISNKLIITR